MSPIRNRIVEMIDYLPEQEQILIFEIVKRFVPDDRATSDDLLAIREAREEYMQGKTINHDDIDWS